MRLLKRRRDDRRELAVPPLEMRKLVGPIDPALFDNPSGDYVYPFLEPAVFSRILDFGCGCGRVARQLIQQRTQPDAYLGLDMHRGMIEWCRANLTPHAPQFEFVHHDVGNQFFNPGPGKPEALPFPAESASFTLVNAISVFTHLTQGQAEHYLAECARVLRPDGVLLATWFLIDRREFPMLQGDMSALYISYQDPHAAVIFGRDWLQKRAEAVGLRVTYATPPQFRGYQWTIQLRPAESEHPSVEIPADTAPLGEIELPRMPENPSRIGLD
jgi:SAM-dependent methyltransferase